MNCWIWNVYYRPVDCRGYLMDMPEPTKTGFDRADCLLVLLVLLFGTLSFSASLGDSVTIDEFRHLSTGVHYWQSGDFSFDSPTPPLWKLVMALPAFLLGAKPLQFLPVPEIAAGWEPWLVATGFMRDNAADYTLFLQAARLVNIIAAGLCLVLLYRRSRQRFGSAAALYGTAFLALSPTFLAHSHYATTDIIATTTLMLTVFMLGDYLQRPVWWRLAAVTLLFAGALLCKYTALLLTPLLLLVPLCAALDRRGQQGGAVGVGAGAVAYYCKAVCLVFFGTLLLINLLYGFRGSGATLAEIRPVSATLSALGATAAGDLPLPLPKAFVAGFDRQKADSDYAEFPSFLTGRWSAEGFRHYYLVAFALKESVPFILLVAAVICRQIFFTRAGPQRRETLLFWFVPLLLLLVLSFMNKLNIGIRYLLPAYPFLCFFISSLYAEYASGRTARLLLSALLLLHTASVLAAAPQYTAYFNELCGGREQGYRYLVDSNLDWGQDLLRLNKYMTDHGISSVQLAYFGHGLPEFYGIRYEPLADIPRPGYAAISASLLQGHPYLLTYRSPPQFAAFDQFRRLRELQPVGRAGASILIYRIP